MNGPSQFDRKCASSVMYSRCRMLNRSIHVWIIFVFNGDFIFFTQFDCGEVLTIGFIVDAGLRKAERKTDVFL